MNSLNTSVLIFAALILGAYLYASLRKKSRYNLSFSDAFNPFYKVKSDVSEELRRSLAPIVSEIETRNIASFINHWTNKFENDELTIEDVKFLNEQLAVGNLDQVNGILALHPEALNRYNKLNKTLNSEVVATEIEA